MCDLNFEVADRSVAQLIRAFIGLLELLVLWIMKYDTQELDVAPDGLVVFRVAKCASIRSAQAKLE